MLKQWWQNTSSVFGYVVGFVLSLALTFVAYTLVVNKVVEGITIMVLLGVLALLQVVVQLIFFLHLGREKSSRFKLVAFFSMLGVLSIVVLGSLWIMYHLDYNMMNMPPEQLQQRLDKEAGF